MLRDSVSDRTFDEVARHIGVNTAEGQWALIARNHWPNQLPQLECMLAIGAFDLYASSLLVGLWIAGNKIPSEQYRDRWKPSLRRAKRWATMSSNCKNISTQNTTAFLALLAKLGVQVPVDDALRAICDRSNATRNKIAHQLGLHDPLNMDRPAAFARPDAEDRDVFKDHIVGAQFSDLFKVVAAIDFAVVSQAAVSRRFIIRTSG
jgi:hypothetical protein